jgi:hypothetical protein
LAIGGLAVIVLILVWYGNARTDETTTTATAAEQVEWSIALTDMAGQTVTLKADLPLGTPSETWLDQIQLERGVGDRWQWDMSQELPEPVVAIDNAADCDALNVLLEEWLTGIGAALGEVYNWQSRAFTQHTVNTMRTDGCTIDESLLTGL